MSEVKFPTEIPDIVPASNDRILLSDASNSYELGDCTLDDLPISSATSTALASKANDSAVVHNTGNENIGGVKTFASSPIVPTPTTDFQVATKKYVDDNSGGGGSMTLQQVTDIGNTTTTPIIVGNTIDTDGKVTLSSNTYGDGQIEVFDRSGVRTIWMQNGDVELNLINNSYPVTNDTNSSTNNSIALFDGTNGQKIKDSGIDLSTIQKQGYVNQIIAGDGPYTIALTPDKWNSIVVTPVTNGTITFTGATAGTQLILQNNSATNIPISITGTSGTFLNPRVIGTSQNAIGTFVLSGVGDWKKTGLYSNTILEGINQPLSTTSSPTFANFSGSSSGTNTGDQDLTPITTSLSGKQIYHGVEGRTAGSPLPTNLTTTTFTLSTGTTPLTYWRNGVKTIVNTDKTVVLPSSTAGIYYIFFDDNIGTLSASATFPGIDSATTTKVIIATVDWNGSNYGIVNDERHAFNRNGPTHVWAHNTIGTRYGSGLTMTVTGTGATMTGAVTSGNIYDEDINFAIGAQTTFRQRYQTGASTSGYDTALTTTPVKLGANNRPGMVNSTSYVWTQVASAPNRYVNYFVFASTTMLAPIHVFSETASTAIINQGGYTSLANARAVPFPNISYYDLSPEFRPLYRLICRADGQIQAIDTTQDDYRTSSSIPFGAGTSSTTAAAVSFAPSGNISATTVQTAIEELDTEKVPTTRTITINGTAQDLSTDRSWTISGSSNWTVVPGSPTRTGNATFTLTDTSNANLYDKLISRGTCLKWTESSVVKQAMVISATYANSTVTVTIEGDTMASIDTSSLKYFSQKAKIKEFAIAGGIGATANDVTNRWYQDTINHIFGAIAYHGTAGTTNATTYTISKNATNGTGTITASAISVASGGTASSDQTMTSGTTTAVGDYLTVNITGVSTTAAVDAYIKIFYIEEYNQYL